jgi:hypothetical protein
MVPNPTDAVGDPAPFGSGHPNLEFIKNRLPDWYLTAPRTLRQALRESQLKSQLSGREVESIRSRLVPIEQFATPLLEQALSAQFQLHLDVTANQLVTMHVENFLLLQTRTPLKQSLLQAALQNFEASEASAGGFASGSALLPADGLQVELIYGSGLLSRLPRFRYRYQGNIDIKPEQFAELSRALDLGGKYQAHLDSVFKPVTAPGQPQGAAAQAVATAFMNSERDAVEVMIHIARMKHDITPLTRLMLLEMIKPDGRPRWDGGPVRYRQLHMLDTYAFPGSLLYGALLIEPDQPGDDLPCVVYMPGDPVAPIKLYESFTQFTDELRRKLLDMKYQQYFQRFVSLEHSHLFFAKLNERLTPTRPVSGDETGLHAPKFDERAELYLEKREVDKPPFELLYDHLLTKTYADSRIVAVPTRDEDRISRLKRWHAFESAGMDLLMVAGFFVPVLGAVMAVVAAAQLMHEAFVAVEDWTHGETEEAINHVYTIGENVAAMAIFAGAVHLAPRVLPSTFIESLHPIKLKSGLTRLWKPELAPFEHEPALPQPVAPDAQGRIEVDGKTWLTIEGKLYRIALDSEQNTWRIQYPADADMPSPALEHNGFGAWRHEGENPMGWDDITGFKRLNPEHHRFDAHTVQRILSITGADEALLRQVHVENLAPPALLGDTSLRFALVRQVDEFIDLARINHLHAVNLPRIEPYLNLLVSVPGWPATRGLRLLDVEGATVGSWNVHPGMTACIELRYRQGYFADLLESIVSSLTTAEVDTLLDGSTAFQTEKTGELAYVMATQAAASKGVLFDQLYALANSSSDPLVRLVQRDFPTLPDAVVNELMASATSQERARMSSVNRIPLRIAEQAREYQQQLRLNRACEGFFLKTGLNPDTDLLGFGLLTRLPGWPADLALDLRDQSWQTLEQLGNSQSATDHHVLIRSETGYQAFTLQGQSLGNADQPFLAALLDALPGRVRAAIGFADGAGEQRLRMALGKLALSQRNTLAGLLKLQAIKPGFKWPERLPDGRVGYPLSGRLRRVFSVLGRRASGYSPELAVHDLFPTFTTQETADFLAELRSEHSEAAGDMGEFIRSRLDGLADEYKSLKSALDAWSSEATIPYITNQSRRQAAFLICNCWKRASVKTMLPSGDVGYELDLSDLVLGQLPVLTARFDHVVGLRLGRLEMTTAEADTFLTSFERLVWLSMSGNRLTAIPQNLTRMTRLRRLSLQGNPLSLDAASLQRLRGLSSLEVLNLNNCPINPLILMGPWSRLAGLHLRNTGMQLFPHWIWRCPLLRFVDLRDNRLTEVSENIFRNLEQLQVQIQLHDNPISPQTLQRAQDLLTPRARMRMGLDTTRQHVVAQPTSSTLWLTDVPIRDVSDRVQRWDELAAAANSADFFRLLNDLTISSDYQTGRSLLTQRVWRVIDAASDDASLRDRLFALAAHPLTCGDGLSVVFSDIEVHVLVFKALDGTLTAARPAAMFKLARSLLRLDKVEEIASQHIAHLRASNASVDAAGVRLAYRIGLANRLDLPAQPDSMLYQHLSGVTHAMLDTAYQDVRAWEQTPAFIDAMLAREFWMTFLESHYALTFEPVKSPFFTRLEALESDPQNTLDEHYLQQLGIIQQERNAAIKAHALELSKMIELQVLGDAEQLEVASGSTGAAVSPL